MMEDGTVSENLRAIHADTRAVAVDADAHERLPNFPENVSAGHSRKSLFKDFGFSDYKIRLQGSFAAREYRRQYRETAFNFVSRLMEEEGFSTSSSIPKTNTR
ncbi:MAG: contractile injection system protein, VgrG/Pvc8 family [Blastocatellia bacterium]